MVNDVQITKENMSDLLRRSQLPFTLTLLPSNSKITSGINGSLKALTKEDIIGLLVVYFAVFVGMIATMCIMPMLPQIAIQFGINQQQLSLLYTASGIGSIFGGLMLGSITNKFGTKVSILCSLLGSSICLLVQGFAVNMSYEFFLIMRFFGGLASSAGPVAIIFIGMKVPPHLRPKYMSYVSLSMTLALVVGPLIGGTLSVYGLEIPFFFSAGVAGAGSLVSFFLMDNVIPAATAKNSSPSEATLSPENYLTWLLTFLYNIPVAAGSSTLGAFLTVRFGLDAHDLGNVTAGYGLVVSLCNLLLFPKAVAYFGLYKLWSLGAMLTAAGFALSPFNSTWWGFMIVYAPLCGMGNGFLMNSNTPLVDSWTTPATKARVMSYQSAISSIAMAVAPLIWGSWLDKCLVGEQLDLYWRIPALTMAVPLLAMSVAYSVRFGPSLVLKSEMLLKKKSREAEHAIEWSFEVPTDEHYMKLGRAFGEHLTKAHYNWPGNIDIIVGHAKKFWHEVTRKP